MSEFHIEEPLCSCSPSYMRVPLSFPQRAGRACTRAFAVTHSHTSKASNSPSLSDLYSQEFTDYREAKTLLCVCVKMAIYLSATVVPDLSPQDSNVSSWNKYSNNIEVLRGQNFKQWKNETSSWQYHVQILGAHKDLQKACYERHWQLISILQQSVNMAQHKQKDKLSYVSH